MTPHEAVKTIIDSGLTQQQLADKCGVNQSTISRILNRPDWDPNYSLGLELVRRGELAKRRKGKAK